MQPEFDVYREQLRKLGHGYPLYEPDPAGEYDHVQVGDVGHIDGYGHFHKAFNVFFDADHPINQVEGVPEGFEPLPSKYHRTYYRTTLPAGALYSSHVQMQGINLDVSGSVVPAGASIRLSCSNQQGAALVIKYPAFREESKRLKDLGKCLIKNYQSWLAFIRNELGHDIRLRDLILVTGCDLTADWATATFVEKTTDGAIEFKAGDPAICSSSIAVWGEWSTSVSVPHRCGPGPLRPPGSSPLQIQSASSSSQSQSSSLVSTMHGAISSDQSNPVFNQCIFVRAFRVSERWPRAPKVIQAAAEPQDLDPPDGDNDSPDSILLRAEINSDEEWIDKSRTGEKLLVDNSRTIYDAVIEYILEGTNADVVLIHDNDVDALIKCSDVNSATFVEGRLSVSGDNIKLTSELFSDVKVGRLKFDDGVEDDQDSADLLQLAEEIGHVRQFEMDIDEVLPPSKGKHREDVQLMDDQLSSEHKQGQNETSASLPDDSVPGTSAEPFSPSFPYDDYFTFGMDGLATSPLSTMNWEALAYPLPATYSYSPTPPSPTFPSGMIGISSRRNSFYGGDDQSVLSNVSNGSRASSRSERMRPTLSKSKSVGAIASSSTPVAEQRREATRRQRIEAEQRRRDEFREGYQKLKDVLPVHNQKSSKVALLDRASSHIKYLETTTAQLQARLAEHEEEQQRLRLLNEKLVQDAVEGPSERPADTTH